MCVGAALSVLVHTRSRFNTLTMPVPTWHFWTCAKLPRKINCVGGIAKDQRKRTNAQSPQPWCERACLFLCFLGGPAGLCGSSVA